MKEKQLSEESIKLGIDKKRRQDEKLCEKQEQENCIGMKYTSYRKKYCIGIIRPPLL